MANEFFSPTELAQIRREQASLIADIGTTATLYRVTNTSDGEGGTTRTLTAVATDEPARFWISSGPDGTSEESFTNRAEQELSRTIAFLTFRWDMDIRIADVLTTSVDPDREYRVIGLNIPDAHVTAVKARIQALR